jgi:hypothetical protein
VLDLDFRGFVWDRPLAEYASCQDGFSFAPETSGQRQSYFRFASLSPCFISSYLSEKSRHSGRRIPLAVMHKRFDCYATRFLKFLKASFLERPDGPLSLFSK